MSLARATIKKGGDQMIKKTAVTALTMSAIVLTTLLGNLLGGNSVTANTSANVTSQNGNTSANVSNQTGVDVLGNTINTSTGVSAQLGL